MNRFEVAHQVGLVPALATLARWQRTPFAYRLVGLAFGMSWVGDSAARLLGGAWSASYWWLPIQFALVMVAVKPDLLVPGGTCAPPRPPRASIRRIAQTCYRSAQE
jgi:hypothetical protein